jgi:hypothetical protein
VYGKLPVEYGGVPQWSGENAWPTTEAQWRAGSDAWENWFRTNAPAVERFKYLYPDEPFWNNGNPFIITQGTWTHNNPGVGKNLFGYATAHISPELKGYVDYWSISGNQTMSIPLYAGNPITTAALVATEKAQGHKVGVYNGYRPCMGSVIIDEDAIGFRTMGWICFKYGLDQYFLFSVTGGYNSRTKNNYIDPITYNLNNEISNGDGVMVYSGQMKNYPAEDRGLAGAIATIRMKNWRRGAQDYEYLWLAKQAGISTTAIVNGCIPKAVWDADVFKNISWSSNGYVFDSYRKQLAILLNGAPEPVTGSLSITSTPSGATVFLDGMEK